MPMWKRMSVRRYSSKSSSSPAIFATSSSSRSNCASLAALGGQQRRPGLDRHPVVEHRPGALVERLAGAARVSGGRSATKVPPVRPRCETRCPLWTSAVSACRRVEREIRSRRASSRSGGSLLPGASRPSRIALPSRSTVSSKVLAGRTGMNTASSAASLSI